jgi:hypothetical protein
MVICKVEVRQDLISKLEAKGQLVVCLSNDMIYDTIFHRGRIIPAHQFLIQNPFCMHTRENIWSQSSIAGPVFLRSTADIPHNPAALLFFKRSVADWNCASVEVVSLASVGSSWMLPATLSRSLLVSIKKQVKKGKGSKKKLINKIIYSLYFV